MPEDRIDDTVHEIESSRFGTCAYRANDVLQFTWGLPGFTHLRRFLALSLAGQEHFVWLQSIDDPTIALPLTDPFAIFDDYAPKLPASALESLEVRNPDDFVLLCVVIVTKDAAEMSCNLLAPVIVNLRSRVGRQVTLEGSSYSVKMPIPRKSTPEMAPSQTSA